MRERELFFFLNSHKKYFITLVFAESVLHNNIQTSIVVHDYTLGHF